VKFWTNRDRIIWILGLLLTLSVGYFNQGIIALDDYSEGFARFIPAQNLTFQGNTDTSGIRLPFQSLFLLALSKWGLTLGLSQPLSQLRFVLMILGALVFCAHTFCAPRFFKTDREKTIALVFTSFYFILPLLYSRPLIENMSGAFVTLGAFFAYRFFEEGKHRWVALSVLAIALASLFRFQSGICVLALPLLFFWRRTHRAWLVFLGSGILCFVLTGLMDFALTGGFHRSLLSYVDYNIHYASGYGTTPFFTFILLFLGLSLPPAFIGRYKGFQWKKNYRSLIPVLVFFLVFVVAHSLIPHKEERFMVPVLVLFLILLTPLAQFWIFEKRSFWRVAYFCVINFTLLPLASFSVPQNNVISLVRFFNDHEEIETVYSYEDSVVLEPKAFSLRPFAAVPFSQELSRYSADTGCRSVLAVRSDKYKANPEFEKGFPIRGLFKPGPLEALLVRLNPRQNARRGSIFLIAPKGCP